MFSQFVFEILVYGALLMSGAGAITLLILLARDQKGGRTW